jgi:hypothetical protein
VIVCGLLEWKRIFADLLSFVYICIAVAVGDPVIKMGGWDPINRFNPATFVYLSLAIAWISNVICRGFFVLSEKVGGSFCYWLNCWPSLFKLSFHDFSYIVLLLPLTVNQLILQRMSFHLFVIYNKYNFKTNLMAFIFKLCNNREYSHLFLKYLKILLFFVKDQARSSSIIFVFVFQLFLFDLFFKK